MATFEDLLEQDGKLVYKTKGTSMRPMLHQNRDLVVIYRPEGRLNKYDVALYRRGPQYVLHRVVEVCDGYYLIRGDNTYALEHVPDSAVIGVLGGFSRKGTYYDATDPRYQRYARTWDALYPARSVVVKGLRPVKRIVKKLIGYDKRRGRDLAGGEAQGLTQVPAQGSARSAAPGSSQVPAQGSAHNTARESAQDLTQAPAQDSAHDTAQAAAQGSARDAAQAQTQSSAQVPAPIQQDERE